MVWAVRDYEFLGRPGKQAGVSDNTEYLRKIATGDQRDADEDGPERESKILRGILMMMAMRTTATMWVSQPIFPIISHMALILQTPAKTPVRIRHGLRPKISPKQN